IPGRATTGQATRPSLTRAPPEWGQIFFLQSPGQKCPSQRATPVFCSSASNSEKRRIHDHAYVDANSFKATSVISAKRLCDYRLLPVTHTKRRSTGDAPSHFNCGE